MGERVFKQHEQGRQGATDLEAELQPKEHNPIKTDLDSILDQIDEVLEENAEEFVKSYVQKGGQ
ncbi:prokaryotic ubiquitin-like protein Pup [Actinomycetes bacterium]|jgi:ubiquitin-like protein Pup|nr:prokaryotic ubiquitin-like protein Pup [Actinomycetes bacterium]